MIQRHKEIVIIELWTGFARHIFKIRAVETIVRERTIFLFKKKTLSIYLISNSIFLFLDLAYTAIWQLIAVV